MLSITHLLLSILAALVTRQTISSASGTGQTITSETVGCAKAAGKVIMLKCILRKGRRSSNKHLLKHKSKLNKS